MLRKFWLFSFVILLSSCATPMSRIQPQINNFLTMHRYDAALKSLGNSPKVYGSKNQLLYWLDRGMILHSAGQYRESIAAFEQAKYLYEILYTRSLHEMASTFLVNDYWESYRGDDQEFVLVHVFQALNFAALGQIHESLVEARAVDSKIKLINDRYTAEYRNVYRDDAFVRLLMGLLYQADQSSNSDQDARISFKQSLKLYNSELVMTSGVQAPEILRRNDSLDTSKATVYLIHYTGFSPIKEQSVFVIPAGGASATTVAFPKYVDRFSHIRASSFVAHGSYADFVQPTEVADRIGSIAKQILENRKVIIATKEVARIAVKLATEKVVAEQVRQRNGDNMGALVQLLGTVYNIATERADLRSWQTLPDEIRIAKLELDPGTYQFEVLSFDEYRNQIEKNSLDPLEVKAGDVRFMVTRSYL